MISPDKATRPARALPQFRTPAADDGPALFDLIASCPPLDQNSRYCNLLQVTHFAATAVLAESDSGELLGAVTGYLKPDTPDCLFIWQVAVAPSARGQRLAPAMMDEILSRPACRRVRWLETSITPDNQASWAAFRKFAESRGADLGHADWFGRDRHFAGRHADEQLLRIGPLAPDPSGAGPLWRRTR